MHRVQRSGYAIDMASRVRPRPLAPLVEQRVQIGGVRTRALALEGAAPTFVLLHGFADSADTWRAVLARLRLERRAALALDLPGFATADPLHDYEGVVEQLGDFASAAAAECDDPVLVGNSLGGSAALVAAANGAAPEAVVAIAPAGFDMGGWIYRLEHFTLLQMLLNLSPVLPGALLRSVIEEIYRQLAICEQPAVADEVVRRFASHHRDRATVLSFLATAQRLLPELKQSLPLEGDITAPTLVVWGEADRMLPAGNAQLVRELVPHARVELLAGCGHCPQIERPQKIAELLLSVTG
jgi:pimeloyl-ACP methyl ester carboxylesterase